MDFKNMTIYPELIEDVIIYILAAVLLCCVSKVIYDWKEKRRQRKALDELQNND